MQDKQRRAMFAGKNRKYPTQQEAEFLIDWTNSSPSTWGLPEGTPVGNSYKKADGLRMSLWEETFGDNSPWKSDVKRTSRNTKLILKWDKHKAELLGIN